MPLRKWFAGFQGQTWCNLSILSIAPEGHKNCMMYVLEHGLQNLPSLREVGILPLLLRLLRSCNRVVNILLGGWRDLVEELAGRGSVALDVVGAGGL